MVIHKLFQVFSASKYNLSNKKSKRNKSKYGTKCKAEVKENKN